MIPTLDHGLVPVLCEDVIQRDEVEGELLLYNPDSDQLHLVKGLGRAFIQNCTGRKSLGAILAELAHGRDELDTPYGRACIARFVQDMVERGLLRMEG